MTTPSIDYYFSLSSPWAYLGHALLHEIAARHGARIAYKPLPLRPLFDRVGGLPLALRPPARQRYRQIELKRWRAARGVPLNLAPRHSPFDASLVDKVVMALVANGDDPAPFMTLAHAAIWSQDRDLSNPESVGALLREGGANDDAILQVGGSGDIAETYERNLEDAVALHVFGAPSYVVAGELFWGQDRLELLDAMLASRRTAFDTP